LNLDDQPNLRGATDRSRAAVREFKIYHWLRSPQTST